MSELTAPLARLRAAEALLSAAVGRRSGIEPLDARRSDESTAVRITGLNGRSVLLRLMLIQPGAQPSLRALRKDEHAVFVAERIARASAAAWRLEGQSFIDLRGQVFIEVPGLVIDRQIRVSRINGMTPATLDPFADRGSLVTRALLEHPPDRVWGVRELAGATGVAVGTASRVLHSLEAGRLVQVTHAGRAARITVPEPGALWHAWTASYEWTRNAALTVAAPVGDPTGFVKRLVPIAHRAFRELRVAFTLQAGASLVSPHATWDHVHVYLDVETPANLAHVAAVLDWPPSPEGRLVLLRPFYRRSLWEGVRVTRGIPVVSDLQLALDLWDFPVRGREQAEVLLARRLPWILAPKGPAGVARARA